MTDASPVAPGQAKLVIVMLTLNQREMTLECLSNVLSIRDPSFELLLWDNGSTDDTVTAVREAFPQVHVHHHPTNLGVAPGRNAAADLAIRTLSPTHMLFLDNDMELEPEFIRELFKPFTESPRVGQTQAKLRFMYDRERLNDGGGNRINFWLARTEPIGIGEIDRGQYDTPRKCVAGGGAMIVRTDIFQELGGFDTGFGHLGPDDLDFSLRISEAGYDVLYVPTAVAYHAVTHTYGRTYDEVYARLKARNWFVFMRRHASIPEQIGFLLIGLPYRTLSVLIRQGTRGNIVAVRGLARGVADYLRTVFRGRT